MYNSHTAISYMMFIKEPAQFICYRGSEQEGGDFSNKNFRLNVN